MEVSILLNLLVYWLSVLSENLKGGEKVEERNKNYY